MAAAVPEQPNYREEARQAFGQRLAANDLEILQWTLGNLGIHTADNLLQLTDGDFEETLKLIPDKQQIEDVENTQRFAPAHYRRLRLLRAEVLREGNQGVAVAAAVTEQPNDEDEDQSPEAAMQAAVNTASSSMRHTRSCISWSRTAPLGSISSTPT